MCSYIFLIVFLCGDKLKLFNTYLLGSFIRLYDFSSSKLNKIIVIFSLLIKSIEFASKASTLENNSNKKLPCLRIKSFFTFLN